MANPNEIVIPVKEFGQFVEAAGGWLAGCLDAKNRKLELRLANLNGNLHISTGGDSAFIEAVLKAENVEAIVEPIWLDLQYLMKFDFKAATALTLLYPKSANDATRDNRQAQFKAPGVNFRIPLLTGETWNRNVFDIGGLKATPGLILSGEFFASIYDRLKLPNSFSLTEEPMFCLSFAESILHAYYCDGFGAYWHQFKTDAVEPFEAFQHARVRYRFLEPYKKFADDVSSIRLQQSDRHTICQMNLKESAFLKFRWMEPNSTKQVEPVPTSINDTRKGVESCLRFDTKPFLSNVDKALMFHSKNDSREQPLTFSILKDMTRYMLDATLSHAQIDVEGETLEPATASMKVKFQAACLKDYLKCLDLPDTVSMEVFRSSVILYQENAEKKQTLIYWLPVHDR